MRFRNPVFGILSFVITGLLLHIFKETSWAIFVERLLEEVAHSLHIERAAMIANLSQILIGGGVLWAALYFAFRVGRAERQAKLEGEAQSAEATKPLLEPQKSDHLPSFDPSWSNDATLLEAIWRVTLGRWDARAEYAEKDWEAMKPFWDAVIQIRQKAFDGRLPIWARRRVRPPSTLFELVPPQFWVNHEINEAYCRTSTDDVFVHVTHPLLVGEVPYARTNVWTNFMTSRAAIEELWPRKD